MISESIEAKDLDKINVFKNWFKPQHKDTFYKVLSNLSKEITYNGKTRILFIVPESAGDIFLSTALLRSIEETYYPCDIYFSCKKQYFEILNENPYIHKVIEYKSIMDVQLIMEGVGDWPGFFDVSIFITAFTQRFSNWVNNGRGKIAFNLRRNNALT